MNWWLKIAAFQALSALPGGTRLYRLAQERLTHSLTPAPARVGLKMDVGRRYADWLRAHGTPLKGATHLDFGTGWHPVVPLLFHTLGVGEQFLFDLRPLLDEKLIAETAATFQTIASAPDWPHRAEIERPLAELSAVSSWFETFERWGLHYIAPYEPHWDRVRGRIDLATSTQVLLHIPRAGLRHCFARIYESLKPGGLFMATIHLHDLFVTPGSGIPPYNHLRFSPAAWERFINSSIMSYSRLKAPDYRAVLEETGFTIRDFEVEPGSAADLAAVERLRVDPSFEKYTREELAARHLFFVAERTA